MNEKTAYEQVLEARVVELEAQVSNLKDENEGFRYDATQQLDLIKAFVAISNYWLACNKSAEAYPHYSGCVRKLVEGTYWFYQADATFCIEDSKEFFKE